MMGVPYAHAAVDSRGYYVRCPECGETFHEETLLEHRIGKSANAAYAAHWTRTHEGATK